MNVTDVGRRVATGALLVLLGFGVVSSAVGAVMGIGLNGAGVPLAYLEGTPFDSYVIPGVILGLVVGGTQLVAFVLLLRRRAHALLATAVAGFGMLIWIFVEMAVIGEFSFLQAIYVAHGILELVVVVVLLGIVPAIVPPAPHDSIP